MSSKVLFYLEDLPNTAYTCTLLIFVFSLLKTAANQGSVRLF
jgi:hypothetical protein